MTNELLQKAKECKSAEELLALAKENNVEMTEKQAEELFASLNQEGELSDDELDSASGGSCYKGKRMVVTVGYYCDHFLCKKCKKGVPYTTPAGTYSNCDCWGGLSSIACSKCHYMSYENGLWLCNNPENYK